MRDLKSYIERISELNPTLRVKEAEINDAHDFVRLFNKYYKRKTSVEYFNWQFFDSPNPSKIYMAYEGVRLIGYYGVKVYTLSTGIKTGFSIDVLIDDEFRKKGVLYLLEFEVVKFCQQSGASLLSALPNAYGNAALKALGWKSVTKIDTLVLDEMDSVKFTAGSNPQSDAKSLVSYRKDSEYRDWRFTRNPQYKYEVIRQNTKCFATTKLFKDPVSGFVYGDIVDFECDVQSGDRVALLKDVLNDMINKKVGSITTWALPHTQLNTFFSQAGFRPLPQERFFCVNIFDSDLGSLADIKNWNLMQADAEIY